MKKIIATLIITFVLCTPFITFAETPEFDGSKIAATSAMLIDANTGEVLYTKGENERIGPASTTKLLTALLTVEKCKMEDVVVTGKEVNEFSSASSLAGIQSDESITVKDLLYGLMLASGNDAAAALAVHMGGSLEGFKDMMNARAKELGMENSYFSNPHGLIMKDQEHYSTGADMAKLALAVYAHPELMEVLGTKEYTIAPTNKVAEPRILKNSNLLLITPEKKPEYAKYLYEYATGMKTGLTQNPWSGSLVASARRGDLEFITLIFGDSSEKGINRWQYVIDMFEFGFENCSKIDLSTYIAPLTQTETLENCAKNDPLEGQITLSTKFGENLPKETYIEPELVEGLKDGTVAIEQEVVLTKPLVAPINTGEEMGYAVYKLNGKELYKAPLVADRKVYQKGEEQLTKEEYNLPGIVFEWQWWYLAIIIPVALVGLLFLFRAYNLNKRKRRMASRPRRLNPSGGRNTRSRGRRIG